DTATTDIYTLSLHDALPICIFTIQLNGNAQSFLVEAESFDNKGGWFVDSQFVEQMGSPYLLAHGLGTPVDNATTEVKFPSQGIRSEEHTSELQSRENLVCRL